MSWDDILVRAAEVGIPPREFWKMTWKEFLVMVEAHGRTEANGWRKFRFLGYMQYLANTTDKVKKSIYDFMPLPDDPVKDRGKRLSENEVINALKIYGIGTGNTIIKDNGRQ